MLVSILQEFFVLPILLVYDDFYGVAVKSIVLYDGRCQGQLSVARLATRGGGCYYFREWRFVTLLGDRTTYLCLWPRLTAVSFWNRSYARHLQATLNGTSRFIQEINIVSKIQGSV